MTPLNAPARRWVARGAAALWLVWAPPALADASPKIVAEQLFTEGHGLLERGDVAVACEKLNESERLDPAGGTALLLGICLEQQSKLASAWATLRSARAMAIRDGRRDRVGVADEHLRDIEPRLAHVTVTVAPAATLPGLVVTLDGVELDPAARGVPIPVDPGSHELRATAPGHVPFVIPVPVPETTRALVTKLAPEAAPDVVPGKSSATRTTAIAGTVALGVVALGLTGYYGIGAVIAEERKPLTCSTTDALCGSQARSLESQRSSDATIATIAGATAVASAAGLAALLLFPPSPPRQVGWSVTPFGTVGAALVRRL
jgi:hypothetical protein